MSNFVNLSDQILSREIDRLGRLWSSMEPTTEFTRAIRNIVSELIDEALEVLNYDYTKLDDVGFKAYCIYKSAIINELLFYR